MGTQAARAALLQEAAQAEHQRRTVLAPKVYKVTRHYYDRGGHFRRRRTIIERCSLEEAQAHCGDPETSSRTATGAAARARTRRCGAWFDSYDLA